VGPYNPGLYELALPGPYDQRPVEERDDLLVYNTDVLDRDIEVTGPVTLHLFASTSTTDTDFVARLTDVHPDERSINITEGIVRARFRERNWGRPGPVKPGKVLEYLIELHPTSNVFMRNHRIRLDITSSCFPLWDRNLNTYDRGGTGTQTKVARQEVHHNPEHLSRLRLPIIPTDTSPDAPSG
jgi:putative CocE/NonD family hydrolase